MSEKFDYVVIGAGIAGTHIGALLAQHGDVLVLEKSNDIGGRARVDEVDGYKLDYGAHPIRFGPNSSLAESFEEIGKPVEFLEPGTFYVMKKDGGETVYPSGLSGVLKSDLVPFWKTLFFMIKVLKRMDDEEIEELYDVSLQEWFEQEDVHEGIRRYLTIASSGMQVNPFPERSSAGELMHNMQRVRSEGSIFYPKGGWETMFSNFEEKIEEEDGEIRLDSEVEEILVEDSKAVGVKVDGEKIEADVVVNTVPVQNLFDMLDEEHCDEEFVEKCKNLRPTAGVAIDFCLEEPITDKDFFFIEEPPSFGFVPTNIGDVDVAPEGKSVMYFFRPANVEDIEDKEKAEEIMEKFREKIIELFPKIEEKTKHERPIRLPMVDGVEVNTEQHEHKRPGNEVEEIDNLYLTGDSVGGEGAGGDVGHTSVRDCYELIKEKE